MSWLHRVLGRGAAGNQQEVEPSGAARVTSRPPLVRGAYSLSVSSGVMAAGLAANSEIFQFRWTSPTYAMLLRSIRLEAAANTTAFAAGDAFFSARSARTWTVDGTGGTAIIFGTDDCKKKRSFTTTSAPSNSGVRCATTAALGVGTKVLDGNDFAGLCCGVTATAGVSILSPGTYLWERNSPDEWPFEWLQNDGFVIRATVPTLGTWQFNVDMEWTEIDPAVSTDW